uniref:SH3 domain-containing protein n=1 Tax=Ascaris lumbricoides TaxID=6252 RepID=A0A0M3IS38_ASCLU
MQRTNYFCTHRSLSAVSWIGKGDESPNRYFSLAQPRKPRPPLKPKPMPLVEALYPYEAQDTDELSFEVGDKFELINKDASGWWQGRIKDRTGLFPANYVKEL